MVGSAVGPLFTFGRTTYTWKAAEAATDASRAEYEGAVLNSLHEVSDALTAREKLVIVRAAREREVAALRESVEIARSATRAGWRPTSRCSTRSSSSIQPSSSSPRPSATSCSRWSRCTARSAAAGTLTLRSPRSRYRSRPNARSVSFDQAGSSQRASAKLAALATSVATSPGRMKLWFRSQRPIRVVPVESNDTAASTVPYVGRKKFPFTAGYAPSRNDAGSAERDGDRAERHDRRGLAEEQDREHEEADREHPRAAPRRRREMPPTIALSLPAKNDEPSQETPRIETNAVSPPFMMLPAQRPARGPRRTSEEQHARRQRASRS